jgi:hypothetical protein
LSKRRRVRLQGDGKGYAGGDEQRHDVDQRIFRHLPGQQRPNQRHALGQRQPAANRRQPAGQLIGREKHPGNQRHRRDEQREVIHEEIVGRRQRIPDQPQPGEGQTGEDDGRQRPEQHRAVRQAERGNHEQNGRPRKQRLGRRPEQLAGDHVGQAERRVENRIPGFLHMHPRKRRVKRLESRRIHRRSAHGAGGEKGDV